MCRCRSSSYSSIAAYHGMTRQTRRQRWDIVSPRAIRRGLPTVSPGSSGQKRHKDYYEAVEMGHGPHTFRSALEDHLRPAPKDSALNRVGESVMAQFRTGTSKHFGWLHRTLPSSVDLQQCRWCTPPTDSAPVVITEEPVSPPSPEPPSRAAVSSSSGKAEWPTYLPDLQ